MDDDRKKSIGMIFRLSYGILLSAILLAPFGVYHSTLEPYISGNLWGFYLPVGYVGLLLGIIVILYPKLTSSRKLKLSFGSLMILGGLILFLSLIFSPKDYFINLLNGTSFGSFQIDVDFPLGNLIVGVASLFSIAFGFVIRPKRPFMQVNSAASSS